MTTFYVGEEKPHDETGRPWYDTKLGITESIGSLEKLIELIYERHTAGYKRNERLNEFYIMGRYGLDTCGNCSKAHGIIPKEILPQMPDVLTRDEFWQYLKEHTSEENTMLSFSSNGGNIPPPYIKCSHCNERWGIDNCYDTVVRHLTEHIPLTDFVGKTLRNVRIAYSQKHDAIYRMQPDILIRNDRFIDNSPEYPDTEEDWQKSIVKNANGWMSEKEGITDEYIIQTGDEGHFNVWKYFHQECNRINLSQGKERKFKDLFEKAGFKEIQMAAIENEYCSCEVCAPWFIATTEFGNIKIGWRKQVINIDWSALTLSPHKDILSLFEGEDVTKGQDGIHAWGYEKAQEYLDKIYKYLS